MKKLWPLLILFSCESVPTNLPLMLAELNITLEVNEHDLCSTEMIKSWEQELLDENLRKDLMQYLKTKSIHKIQLTSEKQGQVVCDFANIQDMTDYEKCDPDTLEKEGSLLTPPTQAKLENGHLSVTNFFAESHRNEFVYQIDEASNENKSTILEMITHEDAYLSFELINEYSLNFPIQIVERDYYTQFKCGDITPLRTLLPE